MSGYSQADTKATKRAYEFQEKLIKELGRVQVSERADLLIKLVYNELMDFGAEACEIQKQECIEAGNKYVNGVGVKSGLALNLKNAILKSDNPCEHF